MFDPYKVLGLPTGASSEAIKTAYRRLASRLHPDRHPGDRANEERFKEINRAYEALLHPGTRAVPPTPQTTASPIDENWTGDFFSLFEQLSRRAGRGAEAVVEVPLTFEEAVVGAVKRIDVAYPVRCPACSTVGARACPRCAGTGVVEQPDTVVFRFPPGTDTHTAVRSASGRGRHLEGVAAVGSSPHWDRQGYDLWMRVPVPKRQAKAGAKIELPTPYGILTHTLPAGSVLGRPTRFPGHGVRPERGTRGDLWVTLEVELPQAEGGYPRSRQHRAWLKQRKKPSQA